MVTRGKFISLEGGDGAGKSTQGRTLAQRLRAKGHEVILTREPGGSPFAERIREEILTEKGSALNATQQAILFAAARADHVTTLIEPALARGNWVVCDRFADSTEAYQGAGGAPAPMMALLKQVAVGDVVPDLTVVLDLAPREGLRRAVARDALDPFEADEMAVQEARRAAFLEIAARNPKRCVLINAARSPDDVAGAIWRVVTERLLTPAASAEPA
ncbi:MAG: dTMP kinase [Pseudomonadota bacterium]